LAKPYFAARIDPEVVVAFLQLVSRASESVEIEGRIEGVATHTEDDRILETAVAGKATYLVTGDIKLQGLGEFDGVHIVSPRQFHDLVPRLRKGGGRS
jgi:predicted nucleic acid-binding protein